MYCTKCGHKNKDMAKFCVKCGAALRSVQKVETSTAETDNRQPIFFGAEMREREKDEQL